MTDLARLKTQLEYLQGQVTGLQAAVRALIAVHPEPAMAARVVQLMLDETNSKGLTSPSATDAQLRGLQNSPEQILPSRGAQIIELDLERPR